MFKTEINKSDIEGAISKALGEKVLIIEYKPEGDYCTKGIKVVKIDKETGRYNKVIVYKEIVVGDIYKSLILDFIKDSFTPSLYSGENNIHYVTEKDLKKKK